MFRRRKRGISKLRRKKKTPPCKTISTRIARRKFWKKLLRRRINSAFWRSIESSKIRAPIFVWICIRRTGSFYAKFRQTGWRRVSRAVCPSPLGCAALRPALRPVWQALGGGLRRAGKCQRQPAANSAQTATSSQAHISQPGRTGAGMKSGCGQLGPLAPLCRGVQAISSRPPPPARVRCVGRP